MIHKGRCVVKQEMIQPTNNMKKLSFSSYGNSESPARSVQSNQCHLYPSLHSTMFIEYVSG